jgi:fatty acid desaturase
MEIERNVTTGSEREMAKLRRSYRERAIGGIEWRTVIVAAAIYAGWLALTWWHAAIPTPLLVLMGGVTIAWHGSLQHETIHGHPTGNRRIDTAIGFVPLSLWLPYALYRRSHIAHHGSRSITDPQADPESRYVDRSHGLAGIAARAQATLPGHMLLGPPIALIRFANQQVRRAGAQPVRFARDWLPHLVGVAVLIAWIDHVGLGFGHYVLCFVYPGMALTTVRAHAEHRAGMATRGRAAIVEHGGPLALLFLNNNLHAAHHERPLLAWYDLPAYHRRNRARFVREGVTFYAGYGDVVRRFAFRPHDEVVHPDHRMPQ